MRNGRAINILLWVSIFVATAIVTGCAEQPAQPKSGPKEAPVLTPPPAPPAEAPKSKAIPPPQVDEIKAAVNRIFKDAAYLDATRNPYFLAGDFNGDLSTDIAVVIKPAMGKLQVLNDEYAPWMIKDPLNPTLPPQMRKKPFRVEDGDVLLAVIHGYGPDGWRNPEATQTYILKGALGDSLRMRPAKASLAANAGKPVPKVFGDTIAQVLDGATGFLYYTGATYAWYDPKTFNPGAQKVAHAGMAPRQ